MNERIKRFNVIDIGLIKLVGIFAGLFLAKLIPQLMNISIWWYVALIIICGVRPFYVVIKRD